MIKGQVKNINKDRGFGFILSENGEDIFFHISNIGHNIFNKLSPKEIIYFDYISLPKGLSANIIIPESDYKENSNIVYPGFAKYITRSHFSKEENGILNNLSKFFYITNGGGVINLGINSTYKYFLLKPTSVFQEQFNLYKEIIVIFSPYYNFEPRTLDAIDTIIAKYQSLRLDRVCSIIISQDIDIERKLSSVLKNDTEMQIIIPFSYAELMKIIDHSIINNRFIKYFYERDLFSFEAPLTKDIYFFGRRDQVQSLLNRNTSNENSGVFGLRRTGKTSILNSIGRSLDKNKNPWILIDCQQIHFLRWNEVLFEIIKKVMEKYKIIVEVSEDNYSESKAPISFEKHISIFHKTFSVPLLILFDEIEHITFDVSLSDHWKKDNDFIKLWQIIRSCFQGNPNMLHYIIAGTNPMCAEMPLINGYDNPLYNQLNTDSYIPPFTVEQTKEMVNVLGGYMGLFFDDYVCAALTQSLGGHPYLIRHFCSQINKFILENKINKPIRITKTIYDQVKPIFNNQSDKYCELILNVLLTNYPEEYQLLKMLALDDISFYANINKNRQLTTHLIGYGIIESVESMYSFRIDLVKQYLRTKNKYSKFLLTNEEKWNEISERRNAIEPEIRIIVKIYLKASKGESSAKQTILSAMDPRSRNKYLSFSYNDLFDPKKCEVYFSLMANVIEQNWSDFQNLFMCPKKLFSSYMTIINTLRADCHAKDVTDEEMNSFRGAITWLEKKVEAIM